MHGSFALSIVGLEQNIVSTMGHFPSDLNTCSGIVTTTAAAPIVAGSGTGTYKGISGSFRMAVSIAEVDSWPNCPTAGPDTLLSEAIFFTGSGRVSLS